MISQDMENLSDLAAGKAGEYLVCAEIILRGHTAFLSEQGLPFDVVADINGRLLRIQVKTTRGLRAIPQRANHTSGYLFYIKRCGKGGTQTYGSNDVDIFAMVALDTRDMGFIPASKARTTMMFRSSALRGQYFDEILKVRCDKIRNLHSQGMIGAAIAKDMGLDQSYVSRVLKGTSGVAATLETYLSEMTLESALRNL